MNTRLLFFVALIAGFSAPVVQAQNPIAYYTFNGNVLDQTGNGNDGTLQGSYSFTPNGLSGEALTLNGDNSLFYSGGGRLNLPDFTSALNNGFTFSVWVDNVSIGTNPVGEEDFISFGALDSPETGIAINNDTPGDPFLEFYVDTGLGGPAHLDYVDIGDPIANLSAFEDAWENLVLVYQPGQMSAYLNGSLYESVDDPALVFTGFPTAEGGLGSHWWSSGDSSRMTATYDNVAIYGEALDAGQVAQIYADGGLPSVPETGGGVWTAVLTLFGLCGWASRRRLAVLFSGVEPQR